MGLFNKLDVNSEVKPSIDWDLIPAETFAIFESWGGRERVRSSDERFYYFFIDNWEQPASLCLMERGIKFARVLAKIAAPQNLIDAAIATQGKTLGLDKSYAITADLKKWLIENVVDSPDDSKVIPITGGKERETGTFDLPPFDAPVPELTPVHLSAPSSSITENEIEGLIKNYNFFDTQYNPAGRFSNYLVDNKDGLTVTDMVTGIMWQRGGYDITSIRKMVGQVNKANEQNYAGYNDWRLPTMAEALSLMEPEKNRKDLYLHPCFSEREPFIFLNEKRDPGGYWFCDFKQGTVFWASGTIPGGFGRLCRKVK